MRENEKQSDFKCSRFKYFDSIVSILSFIISIDRSTSESYRDIFLIEIHSMQGWTAVWGMCYKKIKSIQKSYLERAQR